MTAMIFFWFHIIFQNPVIKSSRGKSMFLPLEYCQIFGTSLAPLWQIEYGKTDSACFQGCATKGDIASSSFVSLPAS